MIKYSNRLEVWGNVAFENELAEKDYKPEKIKSIWCEIIPITGYTQNKEGGQDNSVTKFKIKVRDKAIINLSKDMFFMFKGQKYDIDYFIPNFKTRNEIEIFCTLEVR